jgi:hypothetical protein
MMPKEKLRKADIVTSICLIILGLSVLYGASRMPMTGTYGGVTNVWYVSPAVIPILIGSLIIIFSIGILIRSIRDGGHKGIIGYFSGKMKGMSRNTEVKRIFIIWAWSSVYIFVLLGRINFYLASSMFLGPFMLMFYRPGSASLRFKHFAFILILCAILPIAVGYLFNQYLLVPLP